MQVSSGPLRDPARLPSPLQTVVLYVAGLGRFLTDWESDRLEQTRVCILFAENLHPMPEWWWRSH